MKAYKLRDRASGKFINKNKSSADRIYQNKQTASAAASHLVSKDWMRTNDESWYTLSKERRRAFRESIIEIVEYDLVEVINA